jgi:hypothetical protein
VPGLARLQAPAWLRPAPLCRDGERTRRARPGRRWPVPFADCAWQAGFAAWVATSGLRDDVRCHRLVIGSFIRGRADWATLRSKPGYAAIVAHTAELGLGRSDRLERGRRGLSLRCVQEHVRAIEEAGWLAVIEPGTTARFRPRVLHAGAPNLRREWLLTRATAGKCTPPHPPTAGGPDAGAREAAGTGQGQPEPRIDGRSAADSPPAPPRRLAWPSPWPLARKPRRRGERRRAAEAMRGACVGLARLSPAALASICRPFWACDLPGRDWTPAAVLAALDSEPDGRPVTYTGPVHAPALWARHRLGAWLDAAGRPFPPPAWTRPPLPARGYADQDRPPRPRPWRERGLARPERGLTDADLAERDRTGADPARWTGSTYQRMVAGMAAADDERLRQLAAATAAAAAIPAAAADAEADRRRRALAQVAEFRTAHLAAGGA